MYKRCQLCGRYFSSKEKEKRCEDCEKEFSMISLKMMTKYKKALKGLADK
jgi:hypothetical protein